MKSPKALISNLLLVISGYYVLQYLVIALMRIRYPYELEWLEGSCMTHILRIIEGKGIYHPPSTDFIPYLYTPFFFDVGAVFVRLFGVQYFSTRLLSFLCSLGILGLLALWGKKESGSWKGGLLTVGMFTGTYRWTGAWLDLGRVDSLFLLFLICGAMLVRFAKQAWHEWIAAFVFVLAFMTKQTALPVALGFSAYVFLTREGSRRYIFPSTFIVWTAIYWIWQHLRTDGWFTHYIYIMPKGHGLELERVPRFFLHDLGSHIPVLMIGLVAWVLMSWKREGWKGFLYCGCWAGTMFVITILSRLRHGGYDNTLLPLAAASALALAVMLIRENRCWCYSLALAQFVFLFYNPLAQIPTAEDVAANDEVVEYIRSTDGPVFCPQHAMLAWQAGKETYQVHDTTFFDLTRATAGSAIDQMMVDDLAAQRWDVIVLATAKWFPQYLSKTYVQIDPPFHVSRHGRTRTGVPSRPGYVYVKRTDSASPISQP